MALKLRGVSGPCPMDLSDGRRSSGPDFGLSYKAYELLFHVEDLGIVSELHDLIMSINRTGMCHVSHFAFAESYLQNSKYESNPCCPPSNGRCHIDNIL